MITANEVVIAWKPCDTPNREAFTRGGQPAFFFNGQGVLVSVSGNDKRCAAYVNDTPVMLMERAATNIVVSPRDLSNAAWIKTSMAIAPSQPGIDGTNSATKIFGSAPGATVLQTVVLASSARSFSAYAKKFPGGGNNTFDMTTDGGLTWVTVTASDTSKFVRVSIPSQTVTNPQFGFRTTNSGDSFIIDFVVNETGKEPSSPILTSRAGETIHLPWDYSTNQPMTFYFKFIEQSTDNNQRRMFRIGNGDANGSIILYTTGNAWRLRHNNAVSTVEGTVTYIPTVNDVVELRGIYYADGSCQIGVSVNGAPETVGTQTAALVPSSAWGANDLNIVQLSSFSSWGLIAYKMIVGNKTLDECRLDISPGSYSGGHYLAEKGHVTPPAPLKPRARRPTAAQEHAARVAREFAARQAELKAAEDRRIENARKLWGASETNQPATLRIPKAEKRSSGPKILRLPRSK